jgi:protein-arginine kinase activator protein McsA
MVRFTTAATAEPVSEEEAKIDEKEELKKQMDEAVAAQNFELAAQLRDRIKELDGGNENE